MSWNEKLKEIANTKDVSAEYEAEDISKNRIMAILSYISWLVLIPIFCAKDSRFARFHANQGLVLALAELILGSVCSMIYWISGWYTVYRILRGILWLAGLLLSLFGILAANNGEAKELPVIGSIRIFR